jgi:hypothetical protein
MSETHFNRWNYLWIVPVATFCSPIGIIAMIMFNKSLWWIPFLFMILGLTLVGQGYADGEDTN